MVENLACEVDLTSPGGLFDELALFSFRTNLLLGCQRAFFSGLFVLRYCVSSVLLGYRMMNDCAFVFSYSVRSSRCGWRMDFWWILDLCMLRGFCFRFFGLLELMWGLVNWAVR
jgi:hypothetical protein